jgi:hypothetical protein
MTSTRLRMGATAASVAMFALAVVVLGALTPGYNQWSGPGPPPS